MNFRRILSKSSLRSSSSSGKTQKKPEDIAKLQGEIELLKQTIDSLKVSVESRDAAIGTLAREKEKIYVELKSAQRTNRNLHQQLVDERDIHSKEKDFFMNEIKRLSKHDENEINSEETKNLIEDRVKDSLLDELKAKDEVIYNIGAKYLKIKSSKMLFQKKLEKLQVQNKKLIEDRVKDSLLDELKAKDEVIYNIGAKFYATCETIILLLQDNRRTLDNLLDNLLKSSSVSPDSKKYLRLLQVNASLHYENTQLKIYVTSQQDLPNTPIQQHSEKSYTIATETKSGSTTTKSEEKMNHHCFHSKLNLYNALEDVKKFKYIHRTCSPLVRGTICRSASDSCIARLLVSEL